MVSDRVVPVADIEAVLPGECWIFCMPASKHLNCTRLIGGTFDNAVLFTEEMCCLPCRVRYAIERKAMIP